MAVVYAPDSEFAKEMCKWEAHHTQYGPPGRPYSYQPYPTRMYRAGRNEQGKTAILEGQTAHDEVEQRNLESRGFVVGGQQAALDAFQGQELEHAKLAAEINWDAKHRLSEKAAAEVAEAQEAAGLRHLPSIPETTIKRRGRPAKQTEPSASE